MLAALLGQGQAAMNRPTRHSRLVGDSTEAQPMLFSPSVGSGWRPTLITNGVTADLIKEIDAGPAARRHRCCTKGPSSSPSGSATGTWSPATKAGGWIPQRSQR